MAEKALVVRLLGDSSGLQHELKKGAQASKSFSVTVTESAQKTIASTIRQTERLKLLESEYTRVARTARRGSSEQVAAAKLAADATRKLDRVTGQAGARARASGRSFGIFGSNIDRLSRGALVGSGALGRLGRAATFASSAFLGGAGISFLLRSSSDAASNLAEQTSKANVVFGQASKTVQAFAKDSLALATDEALAAAAAFGALLRPLGITATAAAGTSTRLVELAIDLSSFSNVPVADALQALQSGLVGEVEPLRRFGVLLSEARVQQEAMAETGKTSVKQLTAQEKVQARLALIFRDSAQAQGDFARTQGGLANQQRILAGNIRDLEGAIGQALNPSVLSVTKSLNEWLGDSENQARVQRDVTKAVREGTAAIRDIAAVLKTAADAVGGFKNLVEILLALKVVSVLASWTRALQILIGTEAAAGATTGGLLGAGGAAALLRTRLLSLAKIGPIAIPITLDIINKSTGQGITHALQDLRKKLGPLGPILLPAFPETRVPKATSDIGFRTGGLFATPDIGFRGLRAKDFLPTPPTLSKSAARKGATAQQRTTWFDALIGRREDRVQDIASLRGQAAELSSIAAKIAAEIARVHDKTRKLTLGDDLLKVQRERRDVLREIAAQAKQAADDARQSLIDRQLRALDQPIPQLANLRKRLGHFTEAVEGTFLDTKKTASVLARIRRVLGDGTTKLAADVRAKIAGMLDDLNNQLKENNARLTRGRALDTNAVLAGLGLDRDTMKILQARLASVGAGGRVLGRAGTGAPSSFGFALSGAGAGINIHGPITVVADNPDVFIRELQKKARRTATQTTGPHAGNSSGFTR